MNSSENFGSSRSARSIVPYRAALFGLCNCGHRRNATRLAVRQPSPKKSLSMESDHGFLAFLGNHGDLALASMM